MQINYHSSDLNLVVLIQEGVPKQKTYTHSSLGDTVKNFHWFLSITRRVTAAGATSYMGSLSSQVLGSEPACAT